MKKKKKEKKEMQPRLVFTSVRAKYSINRPRTMVPSRGADGSMIFVEENHPQIAFRGNIYKPRSDEEQTHMLKHHALGVDFFLLGSAKEYGLPAGKTKKNKIGKKKRLVVGTLLAKGGRSQAIELEGPVVDPTVAPPTTRPPTATVPLLDAVGKKKKKKGKKKKAQASITTGPPANQQPGTPAEKDDLSGDFARDETERVDVVNADGSEITNKNDAIARLVEAGVPLEAFKSKPTKGDVIQVAHAAGFSLPGYD